MMSVFKICEGCLNLKDDPALECTPEDCKKNRPLGAMMCDHEYKPYINSNYNGFRLICVKCHKTQREIDIETALAAANARVGELEREKIKLATEIDQCCFDVYGLREELLIYRSAWKVIDKYISRDDMVDEFPDVLHRVIDEQERKISELHKCLIYSGEIIGEFQQKIQRLTAEVEKLNREIAELRRGEEVLE